MIIFNLDGTLSDCKHRQHFVNPLAPSPTKKNHTLLLYSPNVNIKLYHKYAEGKRGFFYQETHKRFEPDYKSFHEASYKNEPIKSVCKVFDKIAVNCEIQIWSGRCESVREKTTDWLYENTPYSGQKLKMRPVGDNTSDYQLKERWLDDYIDSMGNQYSHDIDFVFDSDPASIKMWHRRGIFAFNCSQQDK